MYRLPSQFDPAARHDGMSAAGGGSTSTTCSSCVVTLGAASVLTARLFAARVPGVVAVPGATTVDPVAPASADSVVPPPPGSEPLIDAQSRPVIARGGLILLGLFALPIAAVAALVAGTMQFGFGAIVGIAVFIGLYCWAYERSGRSVGRGAAVAIAMLVGIVLASAAEMAVWLGAIG